LLKYIEEFRKYVLVTGFRNVEIGNLDEFLETINSKKSADTDVQVFDAQLIATWQHLYFAVLNALTAFRNKDSISKKLAIEIMLYASAQNQIRKATETLGVKSHMTEIAITVVGEKAETVKSVLSRISRQINAQPDDEVLELTGERAAKIQKIFGVTGEELESAKRKCGVKETLVNLVIEHMALLSTNR
jgi:tRNA threonylcarbamoyladenosine modification (KEOPS) complex Cgi121 subunit